MKKICTIKNLRKWRRERTGSVGFVPTMGALHDGHLSLIAESNKSCCNTIVSIFLNPAQFDPNEDFETYPQMLDKDIEKLKRFKVACVFFPNVSEIYPKGFNTKVLETKLSLLLEGERRPNFFSGVTTIVAKLFNIIKPSHAFFGAKDIQQLQIIKKMVQDLNYPITIISCPIIREKNGLAMSSRNNYLSVSERSIAATIYKSLEHGKNIILSGERNSQLIRDIITRSINAENLLQLEYVSVADSTTLLEISGKISGEIIVSVAAFLGKTRLIDNFCYSVT